MGQKVNPIALRLGYIRDWDSRWYARHRTYAEWALEDVQVRKLLRARFSGEGGTRGGGRGSRDAGISRIEIERAPNLLKLTLHTARPGIIIGRGGRGVEDIRAEIERAVKRKVHINVQEVPQPELDARLVGENVAGQIERRIAFKRAVRQALQRSMKAGAKGIRVMLSGRLGGAEMTRRYSDRDGKIPLHTLRADVDYGLTEARTASGNIGIKVWVYRGDILPPAGVQPKAEVTGAAAAERPRRGWRRVGAARRPEVVSAEPAPAEEAMPQAEPAAQEEEQKPDVDAGQGEVPEATPGA
jgi:small subunit ribosomal protein S3